MLRRKLWRDLRAERGRIAAVVVVLGLGVALFVASAAGWRDLSSSYAALQEELALADLRVDVAPGAPDLGGVAGVADVEVRRVASVPVVIGGRRLEGRILSLTERLDRLHLASGRRPRAPREVLVETHLASWHGLAAGDEIGVPGAAPLVVVGVAVSPEYLWVARDAADPMPTPDDFGVLWVRAEDAPPGGDQVLVDLAPGADAEAVERAVAERLGGAVLGVTARDELVGVRLLQLDLDGLKEMAGFFPVFFLSVGGFVFLSVLARIVDGQRAIVGTLRALGFSRRRVLAHYLGLACAVGGLAAALGVVAGIPMGAALTAAYAAELRIPEVAVGFHPELVVGGLLLGLGTGVLAGWGPARRAAALSPAEAMRPEAPRVGRLALGLRGVGSRLPLPARLALRNALRRPARSAATALGVGAALVLVLTTAALVESVAGAMSHLFEGSWRYDLRVEHALPAGGAELLAAAREAPGVTAAEVALVLPGRVRLGEETHDLLVEGVAPGGALLRSVDFSGAEQVPSAGGIVLARPIARALGADLQDVVSLDLGPAGVHALRVEGMTDAAVGGGAVLALEDLGQRAGLPGAANVVVVTVDPARRDEARAALQELPGAVRVRDVAGLKRMVEGLMALTWTLVVAMLACSVALAASVLFATASMAVLERRRELATLRALGVSRRAIAASTTLENGALAAIGLALGVPVAWRATASLVATYDSELFSMPVIFSAGTAGFAVLGVALVLLVAQGPALRTLARANLAEAVRLREG